ncbi:hypothetical protein Vretimale_1691 [Volvox reticuliferus]|uniref:1-phosphatidylinositol-4-phosphate 5-kinase n=1 Tax=Volvox reticuliferus TaxID=1737510 RepID=A0A8J4CRZ4_9CHLO|nr:hypothetical protein Vretifemale_15514 [Volvox reticuliferus]GIL95729.1 hypothetical protein Vretimale_1691 [Volvox reticuliferus]
MAGAEVGQPPGEHGGLGQHPGIATLKYSDGSEYKGTLKHGTPHGIGTCVWTDGNRYDGEWRNGVMHGFGTYLWTSGQRYDGEWKDGKRDGVGVKLYADGSTFHGIWRDGKKHGVGVFKPATKDKDKDRAKAVVKSNSGKLMGSPTDGESVSNLRTYESVQSVDAMPLQADVHSKESMHRGAADPAVTTALSGVPAEADRDHERGREREGYRDRNREKEKERDKESKAVFIRAFEDGILLREDKLSSEDAKMIFGQLQAPEEKRRASKAKKKVKRALGLGKKLQQKHGQLLYKGMPGYNLMLRLQHGIRWSVGRGSYGRTSPEQVPPQPPQHVNSLGEATGPIPLSHKLQPSDFTEKVKVFFPSAGSKETPAHPAGDFKWKDYSPRVFRNLRNMYGIPDADYMLSLGGSSALWQLNSPGKSGCMFFLSDDERFLVKTMRKTEIRTLIQMLPEYYKYMEMQPQNMVIRFFGVHGVKQVHGRTVRFVVMHNMFNTDLQIHKKFDLKGSTDGRTTGPSVHPSDPKTVFKDLDLDLQFLLEPASHAAVIRQIASDSEFLRKVDVMDYSLLLGIHFCNRVRPAQDNETSLTHQHQPEQHPLQPEQQQRQAISSVSPSDGAGRQNISQGANGSSPASGAGAGGSQQFPVALHSVSSRESTDGEETAGGQPHSPGALGGLRLGSGDDYDGDHVRNFDLFSDRPELDKQLRSVDERMRSLGHSDQRVQDILSLVRLRILGDQMKMRSKKAYKVYDGPGSVLMALASRRHGSELTRLDEAEEQPGSDDDVEDGQPIGKQPPCLGYQMRALAVHKNGDQPPEEVVLCFGIIDILQEWNARKVLERTVKSFTHDSYAISVAPPKLYCARFADFLMRTVFLDPAIAAARGLRLLPPAAGALSMTATRVHTIGEGRESDHLP